MKEAADLRFVQLGALALRIHRIDPPAICADLARRREQAPGLLSDAALLLDLSAAGDATSGELKGLVDRLIQHGFPVSGLVSGTTATRLADEIGLPVVGRAADPSQNARQKPEGKAGGGQTTRIIERQVRSGQQIYARDGDLVVIGNVGAGAEVIADGSVHVYGALRGRALAGAQGNSEARVFSLDFHAELVSVAGIYKVFEELPRDLRGKAIQVRLDAGQLQMASLAGY